MMYAIARYYNTSRVAAHASNASRHSCVGEAIGQSNVLPVKR